MHANGATTSTLRGFSCACQLSFTVLFREVQSFSYPIEVFREPMATRTVVDVESLPGGPSQSYSTAPVRKWTCAALKTWLKAHGLSYSGMKKDELVAKLERYLVTVAAQ